MKRLIRYSETPQVTGLEYKELFHIEKGKRPALNSFIVKLRSQNDKHAYFESMRGLKRRVKK